MFYFVNSGSTVDAYAGTIFSNASNQNLLYIGNNGNVGIGIPSPAYPTAKLDINGQIKIR